MLGFASYAFSNGRANQANLTELADAAKSLEAEEVFGTVAVGQPADLILLEANPLDDVRHPERRVGVMVRGRWLAEAELQQVLEGLAALYGN